MAVKSILLNDCYDEYSNLTLAQKRAIAKEQEQTLKQESKPVKSYVEPEVEITVRGSKKLLIDPDFYEPPYVPAPVKTAQTTGTPSAVITITGTLAAVQQDNSIQNKGSENKNDYDIVIKNGHAQKVWNPVAEPEPVPKTTPGVITNEFPEFPYGTYAKQATPCTPAKTNAPGYRSPEAYTEVIEAFNVETRKRYLRWPSGETWCNIFVWDATSAMGAEIPHWADKKTGEMCFSADDPKGVEKYELSANETFRWLSAHGEKYGWYECTEAEALEWANKGVPVVAVWKNTEINPKTNLPYSGHIAMVVPQQGEDIGTSNVMIAHATTNKKDENGKFTDETKNSSYTVIINGFGGTKMQSDYFKYFYHKEEILPDEKPLKPSLTMPKPMSEPIFESKNSRLDKINYFLQ